MKQRGFTLILVMAALVLVALASHGVIFVLSQQAQREREAMLLRIGQEYVAAIASYYESSPGSVKTYPPELQDLVEDRRFLGIKRHLREVYPDPISGNVTWEAIRRADGSVHGVHSKSDAAPVRSAAIDLGDLQLAAATRYSDWKFTFVPAPATATERR